jgi:DNA replication protein DnaC
MKKKITCDNCVARNFCKGVGTIDFDTTWCRAQNRLYRALAMSRLPPAYLCANIYTFKVDEYNKLVYEKLKVLTDQIVERVDEGINVAILGKLCGSGKTFSAATILNHYIYKTCLEKFDYENPLGMYISYSQLMNDLRNFDDNEDAQLLFEQIKNVPLLLIDDIGAGILSRFTREQTYLLLDYRFNNMLSTIITSNYNLTELESEDILGPRTVSRLSHNLVGMRAVGIDRRKLILDIE